ncbi:MAG: type II secretion system GspH family protein [Fusobacterium sp.]|nr:type II secretion system GspH family protein [Fusobacterium sp.]
MAEILLSLTIIGVVAAITLPSLTGSINEKTWNTQRKALHARFSQALALMPNLNSYGTLNDTTDTATETFITNGLTKVMKINNICNHENLKDCGIPDKITTLNNNTISNFNTSPYNTLIGFNSLFYIENAYSQIDTKAAAFETANGESILTYYNPYCQSSLQEINWTYVQSKMCANFVYDLNGNKGPNTVGKDIGFISALYPSDPIVVAPLPLTSNTAKNQMQKNGGKACTQMDKDSRLPNIEELSAMFYNNLLIGISPGYYWSSSIVSSSLNDKGWDLYFQDGLKSGFSRTNHRGVRCIKR